MERWCVGILGDDASDNGENGSAGAVRDEEDASDTILAYDENKSCLSLAG